MITNSANRKKAYSAPKIERIKLDNQISMVMLTLPPDDGVRFSFLNLFKLPFKS